MLQRTFSDRIEPTCVPHYVPVPSHPSFPGPCERSRPPQIDDVKLPPWAHNSPARFVETMRAALESEHVSAHIHEWIDLVFGHKQSGAAAEAADNVFYHLTYENAVDLEAEKDPEMRRALQQQVLEFGQMPRQLLSQPHPCRNAGNPESAVQTLFAPAPQQVLQSPQSPQQVAPSISRKSSSAAAASPSGSVPESPGPRWL